MTRLKERSALVTGGARGIGAAIAERLAAEGARVVAGDIDAAAVKDASGRPGIETVVMDATDDAAMREIVAGHGPFDILVNNVGMDQHAFFTETTPADWERLMRVNLFSVFACTQAVLPAMQRNGWGRLICISSEAARAGSKGAALYAAAKGGVISFMRSLARENARFNITANSIAPGPTRTPMLEQAVAEGGEKLLQAMTSATILRRLGEPAEVAAAAAFLASDDAAYITGETLGVSGGMGISTG